jgi:energy-coupling factor transporter ATP-binding protein EcfA2
MTPNVSKYLDYINNFQPSAEKSSGSIYDYLLAIKKELISIDVPDLSRLIAKTADVEEQISAKNILLFIGETGSGKTTTIKSLLGYKMGKRKFKGMSWVTIVEAVTDPKVLEMHSNPSCKSVTRYVVAAKPKPEMKAGDVYLADTPGWGDTAGIEVQLANNFGVRQALRGCRTVVPVIVISKESWGLRGLGIRGLAYTVSSVFEDFEAIKTSVVIVMNRFTKEEMEQMEFKFANLIETTDPSDKANINYCSFLNRLHQLAMNK